MQRPTVKWMLLTACAMSCAVAMSMPSRSELKNVQGLVNELMASDIQAMKSGKLKPAQVAANAERLACDAQGEAAKFLLYKGAFGLYVQGGRYDEAISAIDHLNAAVKDVPDKVLAEILREKLKRIPKNNGSAIFNLYDGICRRMAAMEERAKLEKQLKAAPADKQTRRALAVRCAQLGDWKSAREHFAELRGKEAAALKAEGSDIAEAADFWWGYQPGVDGVDEEPFREYAASLYRRAIAEGKLAGLKLVLAKKRVAEVGEVGGDAVAARPSAGPAAPAPAGAAAAEKPRGADARPAAVRTAGGRASDWALPKGFKGTRYKDLDVGAGEAMTFFAIPAGLGRCRNERQRIGSHDICITYPFWVTRIPVTSRQFRVSGIEPATGMGGDFFEEKFADDKEAIIFACPTIRYAEQYASWLTEKFGAMLPDGWVFRLPTQGEMMQMAPGCLRPGYQFLRPGVATQKQWLDAVHAKGLFADYKTFGEINANAWRYRCVPATLLTSASDFRKDKNLALFKAWETFCLDRVVNDGDTDGTHRAAFDPEIDKHLAKVLNYQQKETDPFRYVADGTPRTWISWGIGWWPESQPLRSTFHIVAGPDYVGEWKAKNGK